jgi:hypothetical protein
MKFGMRIIVVMRWVSMMTVHWELALLLLCAMMMVLILMFIRVGGSIGNPMLWEEA